MWYVLPHRSHGCISKCLCLQRPAGNLMHTTRPSLVMSWLGLLMLSIQLLKSPPICVAGFCHCAFLHSCSPGNIESAGDKAPTAEHSLTMDPSHVCKRRVGVEGPLPIFAVGTPCHLRGSGSVVRIKLQGSFLQIHGNTEPKFGRREKDSRGLTVTPAMTVTKIFVAVRRCRTSAGVAA